MNLVDVRKYDLNTHICLLLPLGKNTNAGLRGHWQKPLDCVMVLSETKLANNKEEEDWECENSHGRFIDLVNIHYDSGFKDPVVGPLKSGETVLHVEDAIFVSNSKVIIKEEPRFTQQSGVSHRRLATSGNRSVLLVRIKANDGEPTHSESVLASKVFGIGNEGDSFNLSSGYDQCSYGKLKMQPTNLVENGVHTMELNQNIIGETHTDVRNVALDQLRSEMGTTNLNDMFDHIAFCLPPGTKSKNGENILVSHANASFFRMFMSLITLIHPYAQNRRQRLVGKWNRQWLRNFIQRRVVHKY
jgi:hypothetical protein